MLPPHLAPTMANVRHLSSVESMYSSKKDRSANMDYQDEESFDDEEENEDDEDQEIAYGSSFDERTVYNSFSATYDSRNSPLSRKQHLQNLSTNESPEIVKNVPPSYKTWRREHRAESPRRRNRGVLFSIPMVFFIIFVSVNLLYTNETNTTKLELTRKQWEEALDNTLNKAMEKVQAKFPSQRANIWNDILSRIFDVVLYPEKPSVITLFANESRTMNCLAQLLGEISGSILGTNTYLMLTPIDFGNDLGEVIYNLKMRILEKRAVVIQDLLSVNMEAIKAFHNFCDRENPLVDRTIYIITIVANGYQLPQKELEFIEKKFYASLSGEIEKDILDPLITRITDGVIIPVQPEAVINRCSLSSY